MKLFITSDQTAVHKIHSLSTKITNSYRSGSVKVINDDPLICNTGILGDVDKYIKHYKDNVISDIKDSQAIIVIPGEDGNLDNECLFKIMIAEDNEVPVFISNIDDDLNDEKLYSNNAPVDISVDGSTKTITFVCDSDCFNSAKDVSNQLATLYGDFESRIVTISKYSNPTCMPIDNIKEKFYDSYAVVGFVDDLHKLNKGVPYCLKVALDMKIPVIYSSSFESRMSGSIVNQIYDQLSVIDVYNELLKTGFDISGNNNEKSKFDSPTSGDMSLSLTNGLHLKIENLKLVSGNKNILFDLLGSINKLYLSCLENFDELLAYLEEMDNT